MAEIKASMGGTVWKILVQPGDRVEGGQEVAILESMKMEIPITAETAGIVKEICKNEGDFVQEEETLIRLEPEG
ncbi:MAG: acetyl-CoA carboxylase biotin carboxyl carrier protein subunit [Alicyclobacillaceae bacterium]|nr:acetyl-CoA carboxylase biotin carboxyl carrier protein subunit [Alicyclobacillaceae bacterium]